MAQTERDFPLGHPSASDYDPASPEAIEWARVNVAPFGTRDFPVDHPKAVDTPGNTNHIRWEAGVDPHNPHREAHTGRTPFQAAAVAAMSETASRAAKESPITLPLDAVEVNAALNAKRAEVGRDILTPEEYSDVIGKIQSAPRNADTEQQVRDRIDRQHRALNVLINAGYTRDEAMDVLARKGADYVLGKDAGAAG